MRCINSGKGCPLKLSPVVLSVITPESKSTSTSSPALIALAASGHSTIGSPILMEFL